MANGKHHMSQMERDVRMYQDPLLKTAAMGQIKSKLKTRGGMQNELKRDTDYIAL